MKVQATHTIKRSGKVVITKGDVITESQAIKKKVTQYTTPLVTNGRKAPWTEEEVDLFASIYHKNSVGGVVNSKDIVSEFLSFYTTHSPDGVAMMVNQSRGVDSQVDVRGLEGISPYLVGSLRAIEPDRF